MSMPIQRQSEQYGAFESGPRWERDRGQHDLPSGLAGLVNSMGPRITGGMLNTRTAVNTEGMDPNEHAYGRQKHNPLFGEYGHDGYDYEGVSRGEFNRRMRDRDIQQEIEDAKEDEDDETGYNWGPVPPEHLGAVAEDHSGGDEDDPDWIREHSSRQQETNRKRGDEISRSKEMFARRGSDRHPFDRTAAGIDSSGVRPGPLVDAPLYEQDPEDAFGSRPYSGAFCPTCDRPVRWMSGPDCRHASLHTGGLFDGGIPHDHDVSWEQTDEGWSHPATKARVSQSEKHPGEWEIHLPTVSKRRPYVSVGHHPDPQVLMQDHDWNTGYGPAPDWHGEPKWYHRVVHPPLPAHTGAAEAMDPAQMQAPMGGGYQIGHRVGLPWRDQVIPGTVIGLDGPSTQIRWDDGQYSTEEPHNIQLL